MRKTGIINPALMAEITGLGHTQSIVIADSGLPIPENVKCIDLSLVYGQPRFIDVLKAVAEELCIEGYIAAEEIKTKNPEMLEDMLQVIGTVPGTFVPHTNFKETTAKANAIIRTGENTPYSNVILIAGCAF